MREQLLPILESHGVDLVLCGHSHVYERTKFLTGHYGFSSTFSDAQHVVQPGDGDPEGNGAYIKVTGPNAGAVYTVTGSAGQADDDYGLGHPAMVRAMEEAGSVAVDVSGRQLELTFIHRSGEVRDTFRVVHQVPPVAQDSVTVTAEDTSGSVPLTASDENGDDLTAVIVAPPAHGILSGEYPALTYTPVPDWHGTDSFTWKANDGRADSNAATVTITVTPAQDPPVAHAATVLTAPETPVLITLTGSDLDGDALTFAVAAGPASGSLTGTPPGMTFTPAAGFSGTVTFSFTASDGVLVSAPATVTIRVDTVPVVGPRAMATDEDTAAAPITLTGSDADGHPLTFHIASPPAHGTLGGTLPQVIFTPAADYFGADSFTYQAHDGFGYSAPATVSITIAPVNDRPVALAQTVASGPPLSVNLAAADVDGDVLTYSIVAPPPAGSLSGTPPALTWIPPPAFLGTVEFTFKVTDGTLDSTPAMVTLTVENALPAVPGRTLQTNEDTAAAPLTLTGTDANEQPLTFAIVTPPAHGTLSGTLPQVIYTPAPDYYGADSFTYKANDGFTNSVAAAVNITVLPVNDPPAVQGQTVSTGEDTAVEIALSGSDADGTPPTFSVVTPPAHGTLSGTAPALTYTPNANFHGDDSFTFSASDGMATAAPALVEITVTPVNDPPVPVSRSVSTVEDTPVTFAVDASDVEGNPLTFSVTGLPAHGTVTAASGEFTYTPAADFNGPDSFAWEVSDGTVSVAATVTVMVVPVNDAPVTAFDVFSVNEDESLTVNSARHVLRNDSDLHDGAPGEGHIPLTAVLVSAPPHASAFTLGADGTFSYTPRPDFHGLDGFSYRAVDAAGAQSEPETVLIMVWGVNDAPVAMPQSIRTLEDVPVPVRLRSADVDLLITFDPADWLGVPPPNYGPASHDADPAYTIVSPPEHGTLSGAAPHLIYTPNAGYHGEDAFSFTANDGLAASNAAVVTITIDADSDGDALPDAWELAAFAALAYDGGDDPDGDGQDNSFEFIAGNDPADANSRLDLEPASPLPAGGVFRINRVLPGVRYRLQSSGDLFTWDTVSESTFEIAGPGVLRDPGADTDNPRHRYYRAIVAEE